MELIIEKPQLRTPRDPKYLSDDEQSSENFSVTVNRLKKARYLFIINTLGIR